MVRLPEFPSNRKSLNLYFINIFKLLDFLKKDIFTGYIKVITRNFGYFLFFEQGEVLNIWKVNFEKWSYIKTDEEEVVNLSEEGELSIYELSDDIIFFWANIFDAKILYPNLSSEFTNFVKLINKLKKERLTGVLEIDYGNEKRAFIYFLNGSIAGYCCSWKGWVFEPGEKNIFEMVNKYGNAIFNVYSIPLDEIGKEGFDLDKALEFFEKIFILTEKELGEKKFSLLWRKVAMDLSDRYPFLDPFADQFIYDKNKIMVKGKVSESELIGGLKDLTHEIITRGGVKSVKRELLSIEKYSKIARGLGF